MGSYFLPARVIGRVAFPIIASVCNFPPDHVCGASAHPIAPLSGTTQFTNKTLPAEARFAEAIE
jgi:hypothetical protein